MHEQQLPELRLVISHTVPSVAIVTLDYSLACQIYYRQNLTISVTIGLRITISYNIYKLHTLR